MSTLDTITADLTEALKSREEVKVSTLRLLISNINNAKIAKGEELSDDEVAEEIAKDAKRHRESIDAFVKGGRSDLADKEKEELAVLEKYLPEQLTREEIAKFVVEAISQTGASSPSNMGKVMSAVMAKVKGRADGGAVSALVKEKLG